MPTHTDKNAESRSLKHFGVWAFSVCRQMCVSKAKDLHAGHECDSL